MLSSNQIKRLYQMSFHSPKGHNLRRACLKAMGKIKTSSEETELEFFLRRIDGDTIEEAPKEVQGAVKEEGVLLAMKTTIESTKSQLPAQAWATIKKYFTDKNIGIKEIVHSKATPDSFSGRFFAYVDAQLKNLTGKDLWIYLYKVIVSKTPEDLASANNMAVEDFYKTLGVSPATFGKYILTFGGVLAFMDTHTAHIVEKWITVAKVAIPGLLKGIGLGAIILKIGIWLAGAWLLGLIIGPEVLASFIRKFIGAFIHIPIIFITNLIQTIKASLALVAKIASNVFGFVKSWFTKAMHTVGVMKQARLLANLDPSFKRAYLSLPQVI